jgi:hypothetical protein
MFVIVAPTVVFCGCTEKANWYAVDVGAAEADGVGKAFSTKHSRTALVRFANCHWQTGELRFML